jgi:hypothetical protein
MSFPQGKRRTFTPIHKRELPFAHNLFYWKTCTGL